MGEKRTDRLKKWFSNQWHRRVFILGVVLCAFSLWFFPTWSKQQKLADHRIEELIENIVYIDMEKMSDEEIQFLFQNYTNKSEMTRFKKERKENFIARMNLVSDLQVKEVVLTRHEDDPTGSPYFQLGFICELDDSFSGTVYYGYWIHEDGNVEKVLSYSYKTVKNKLLFTGSDVLTVIYRTKNGLIEIRDDIYMLGPMICLQNRWEEEY